LEYIIGWIVLCAVGVFVFGPEGLIVSAFQKSKEGRAKERERRTDAERKREQEKLEAKLLIQRKEEDLRELRSRIQSIVSSANSAIIEIPSHLTRAEAAVSQSVEKFERRSFYPFWDSIESAAEGINAYNESIRRIKSLRLEYAESRRIYRRETGNDGSDLFDSFPIGSAAVPALRQGGETADRINRLYDLAHSDFEFSNIYATWRTNRTLVAGFQNLSNGLHAIREDLNSLKFTVLDGFDMVSRTMERVGDKVSSEVYSVNESLKSQKSEIVGSLVAGTAASSQRESEMISLLTNIQYGRTDLPGLDHLSYLARTRPK
jgi:hypothetical protein